jgi:hypothetical protein
MLPQFWTLRLAVKQAYGVKASAVTKDRPERVQKPADKMVEGSARHEWPVGLLLDPYGLTAGKDRPFFFNPDS